MDKNSESKYLHMCLSAPADWCAWTWMHEGDICSYCDKKVTLEDIKEQGY